MWVRINPKESYHRFRDVEGHCKGRSGAPRAFVPCVNLGSSVPWEGKNSKEQQGAGDACQTDIQTDGNGETVSSLTGCQQTSCHNSLSYVFSKTYSQKYTFLNSL